MRRVAILVVAAALTGCGGGGSDEEQIRALFADMRSAVDDERWTDACALLSPQARRTDFAPDCEETMARLLGGVGAAALPLEVDAIEFQGDGRAIVRSPAAGGERPQTKVIRLDDEWRLAADADF